MNGFSDTPDKEALEEVLLAALPQQPESLRVACAHQVMLGGKRVRPMLLLQCAHAVDGNLENAMHAAVAVELFHNFTLAHDDIMDGATLRRGKPTVVAQFGLATAILAGDALYAAALQALERAELPAKARKLFHDSALEVCAGQQYDMEFEQGVEVTMPRYLGMIEAKTAALLGAAAALGVACATSNGDVMLQADRCARAIGIAFQLQDDTLDLFGNVGQTGKAIGGDAVAGKKSLPFLIASTSLLPKEQKLALEAFANAEGKPEGVAGLISQLTNYSVDVLCEEHVTSAYNHAIRLSQQLPKALRDVFTAFTSQLVQRTH